MSWIITHTGRHYYPLNPRAEDVCIEDIAHALSNKCRFTGHCPDFYSVAQHSILVSEFVHSENMLWGLLHDAAEAYLPDVSRPIKPYLKNFHMLEGLNLLAIAEYFNLQHPMPLNVEERDTALLRHELYEFFQYGKPLLEFPTIRCMSPKEAEVAFLKRYVEIKETR